MLRGTLIGSVVISLAASLASSARAQCLDFATGFTTPGVVGLPATSTNPTQIHGRVYTSAIFDDGTGEALYVGGLFLHAGETATRAIARWDGKTWSDVGGGIPDSFAAGSVESLVVFDDGTGPALYAGGNIRGSSPNFAGGVLKWDGSTWSLVGSGIHMGGTTNVVTELAAYDSGSGPELYAGGRFSNAGGVPVASIAKWNGSAWSAVGSGIPSGSTPPVNAMVAFDDGSGAKLYVGGAFGSAGGAPGTQGLARWDGSAWSGFSPFTGNGVECMTIYDDGSGPALFIGGTFSSGSPIRGIARWDGTSFTTMDGPFATIQALGVFDDGSGHGRELYAGGTWNTTAFGVAAQGIVRYDGTSWRDVGPGVGNEGVRTIRKFGESLYVGGFFGNSGTLAVNGIASFDGASWSALGGGEGIDGDVHALTMHDDGTGPALYAAGRFRTAGSAAVSHIAKWDGSGWERVGSQVFASPTTPFTVLASIDDGSGPQLFAGGDIWFASGGTYNLARFDGTDWFGVGGVPDFVRALAVYDPPGATAPTLYIAGEFGEVLRWNGSGTSLVGVTNGSIESMAVYDDLSGSGPKLFIGGPFTTIEGIPATGAACFDGKVWTSPAGGPGFPVYRFAVYHDGTGGPGLYAAIGSSLRRWNGTAWSIVGDATGGFIYALAVSGDGTSGRPSLYIGGDFTSIGGVAAKHLARWNGTAFSAVIGETDGRVRALCAFRDNTDAAPDLYIVGEFEVLDGVSTRAIAKYEGCTGPGTPYCFADGTVGVACPCAAPFVVPNPQGSAFGGCASSFNPHGGSLTAVGVTNPDTVTLHATGLTPAGFTVFIKSDALVSGGFASHDGVRCTGGAFVRFGSQNAVNGTARYPNPSLGLTLPLSVVGSTPPGSGLSAFYQPFYRNVTALFCNAGTINFTNTYGVVWN